jgi:hypothetical protein
MSKKSVKDIASIVDKPEQQVLGIIKEQTPILGKLSLTDRLHNAQIKKDLKKKNSQRFKDQDKTSKRMRDAIIKKPETSKYQTKEVNLKEMICVRIDAKTCIFIRPGQDPEKEKQKFMNQHKRFEIVPDRPWKKVSNFK